jgi:serine/threonine protein kinase
MPDYRGWEIVRPLGEGGQGNVFLVRSPVRAIARQAANTIIQSRIVRLNGIGKDSRHELAAQELADAIANYSRPDVPDELGALKQFKMPQGAEAMGAIQRLKNEIQALRLVEGDAAALRVFEFDEGECWMVTDYHPRGSLSKYPGMFKGQVRRALLALRPIVALLARLHQQRIVHRDIKPHNILLKGREELVLGDFGIVFLEAPNRPTELLERVGSRDWMAPWAHTGMRVDEVRESFDVFSLGKVLWCMISGLPMLPFWYHRRPQYLLTTMFPNDPAMHVANRILDRCIVEDEASCLTGAGDLLLIVDEMLNMLNQGGQLLDELTPRPCRACGIGAYKIAPGRFPLVGSPEWDIYACDYCDHIQIFGRSKLKGGSQQNAFGATAEAEGSKLELSSVQELRVQVRSVHHPATDLVGLGVSVVNDRSTDLKSCRVKVSAARTFDRRKSTFRVGSRLKPIVVAEYQGLLAGDAGKNEWLLRIGEESLEVGSTHREGILQWPSGDASGLQIWLLDMCVEAEDLEPWNFEICVEWTQHSNTILVRLP